MEKVEVISEIQAVGMFTMYLPLWTSNNVNINIKQLTDQQDE